MKAAVKCKLMLYAYDSALLVSGKDILEIEETLSMELASDVIFGCCYVRAQNASDNVESIGNYLVELQSLNPESYFILSGDFNARVGRDSDFIFDDSVKYLPFDCDVYSSDHLKVTQNSKDHIVNEPGKTLLTICKNFGLHIVNGRLSDDKVGNVTCVTANGASVVDYFLTSYELFNNINYFNVMPKTDSDHFPLICHVKSSVAGANPHIGAVNSHLNKERFTRYRWVDTQKQLFQTNLMSHKVQRIFEKARTSLPNVDLAISNLNEALISAGVISKCRSNSRTVDNQPPWFGKPCKSAKRTMYDKLNVFRKNGTTDSLEEYKTSKRIFKQTCRDNKREYQNNIRSKLAEASSKGCNEFWDILKTVIRGKINSPNDISVEEWYDYFSKLYTECHKSRDKDDTNEPDFISSVRDVIDSYQPSDESSPDCDNLLDNPITEEEILQSLHNLKHGKSPGPDGIPGEFYQFSANVIVPLLVELFNNIFNSGNFPSEWGGAIIIPLFKKGSRSDKFFL
ncbi:uncharacterized protein LOC144434092 [Glandiceps talaboti]